jgi:putative methyltransferase (TIGR04325 family)
MSNLIDEIIRNCEIGSRSYDPTTRLSAINSTQADFADETFSSRYYHSDAVQTFQFKIGFDAALDIQGRSKSLFEQISIQKLPEPRQRDVDGFLRFISLLTASGYSFDKNGLSILDFGGHTGNLFYSTRPFINVNNWHVVEFPYTCERGENIRNRIDPSLHEVLTFSAELPKNLEGYVAISNGVVMHLPDPFSQVSQILSRGPAAFWLGNVMEIGKKDMQMLTKEPVLIVSGGSGSGKSHYFSIVPHGYYADIAKEYFSTVLVSARGHVIPCLYKNTKTEDTYFILENSFDYFFFD